MAFLEDIKELQATGYTRPLKYTVDKALPGQEAKLRYVYDQGALRCSLSAEHVDRACYVARGSVTTIARESPSFLYLDVGCWVDDAGGNGEHRRDFALVCGSHVYLCEAKKPREWQASRVLPVQNLLSAFLGHGLEISVVCHAVARDVNRQTVRDPNVYLLLGDLHMPPASWFYSIGDGRLPVPHDLPEWLAKAPAMIHQKDNSLRYYHDCASEAREAGEVPRARARSRSKLNPDIFVHAGNDLVHFLGAICRLPEDIKANLHFVQTGDMFELWVGRDYEFVPSTDGTPVWRDAEAPARIATWSLEVIIQNLPVFEAFRRLERGGLAEVKYLEGNHDAYLRNTDVTGQLGLPSRGLSYRGLSDDLVVEHGHRFDDANFDQVNGQALFSGPWVTKKLISSPGLRKHESAAEFKRIMWNPQSRDGYLLGATLLYLFERFSVPRKPFSIYAMGHTHHSLLRRFDVRADYSGSYHEEATEGQERR